MTAHPARLTITPTTLAEANAFVIAHHRHHGRAVGHIFSLAVAISGRVVGVAIIGRPVSRMLQDGWTLEVTRCCTDGTEHAASKLYARAWRVAQLLGYRRLITYTLDTEAGTSICAAGWRLVGPAGGGAWSRASRPRVDRHPLQRKMRFEVSA